MTTIQLHPRSLLVGLAIGACALLAMSQSALSVNVKQMQSLAGGGKPPPASMVTIDCGDFGAGPSGVTFAPLQSLVVYTVPTDRWLVLTFGGSQPVLDIREDSTSGSTTKASWAAGIGVGEHKTPLSFAPGSQVVLVNPSAQVTVTTLFHLEGYLRPASTPTDGFVAIDSMNFTNDPNSYVTIAAGSTLPLYDVPSTHWFVLTDVQCPCGLVEVLGSTVTNKAWMGSASGHKETGIAFAPGSTVALRNSSISPLTITFHMRGYLDN